MIKRILDVQCPNPSFLINRCDYALLVPANRLGKQEILEYKYPSIQPANVMKTEENEYYLKWKGVSFMELSKGPLEVQMKIRIKKYDLKTAKTNPVFDKTDLDTLFFLKDEENFRFKSKKIKETAAAITGNNREEIVKSIFEYVIKTLDYHIYFFQDRGAKQALKDGKGDCTEYSELMVTLCRAKKIPSRIVKGLIPDSNGEVGHHNWVEVFFPLLGWVAFDPTWADHPSATTTFYTMKNTYVQLSYKRFIKTVLCPCNNNEFPFSGKLKDTCADLSKSKSKIVNEMQALYKKRDTARVISLLDTLLGNEPDNFRYWIFKGISLSRKGEFEKGNECLQNGIKYSSSNYEKCHCIYALANFHALKGEGDSTITKVKEAIALGFTAIDAFLKDEDFIKLKNYPPFNAFEKELRIKQEESSKKKQD